MGAEFVQLSLVPLMVSVLAAIACALPGNFLLLRRQALIGDAISHVVLPGIVAAFLLTGTVSSLPMMVGAAAASLVAVGLIELIRRVGRVEAGAAMGVVFTTLFALGVLVLEQSDTASVHLDVEHALYGNVESLIWFDATGWASLFDLGALSTLPAALPRLVVACLIIAGFIACFWKELQATTFDTDFARLSGINTGLLSLALMVMTALAAVTAFDAVGSIIVIAMFICPPAAARLMTERLSHQIGWSIAFATLAAVIGYVLAGYGPLWLGGQHSLNAAGMIATVSGLILAVACMTAPHRHRTTGPSQP